MYFDIQGENRTFQSYLLAVLKGTEVCITVNINLANIGLLLVCLSVYVCPCLHVHMMTDLETGLCESLSADICHMTKNLDFSSPFKILLVIYSSL